MYRPQKNLDLKGRYYEVLAHQLSEANLFVSAINPKLWNVHSIISKAGISRIYAYGSTTANHEVKYIATIVYVDQYDEKNDEWGQIDAWVAEDENNYYLSTAKSLKVDRGYYYRVHCDHIAGNEYPYEENASTTNGILIP